MRRRAWVVCLVWLLLVLVACDDGETNAGPSLRRRVHPRPTSSSTHVIGLVGTISGPEAWRGEDAVEGADLAVQVINRELGEDEQRFELVTRDDEGNADRAIQLVEELAASDRTIGIVYAGPPDALPATESALAAAGIPAILSYGDLYGARKLSAHVFQASPSYVWEARRLARYALADRRYETVGALVEDSMDGHTATNALRGELGRAGGRLEAAVAYDRGEGAFAGRLNRLKRKGIEALVVQGTPQALGDIVAALDDLGATYTSTDAARIASEPKKGRSKAKAKRPWKPQVLTFDDAVGQVEEYDLPAGIVGADTYARGAHYLPVPSFVSFNRAFQDWWGFVPTGWELRAFEATRMIAWAAQSPIERDDLAVVLEGLDGARFGGLDITLGPDDHTSVGATTVGLWVVPSAEARVPERDELPEGMPWVPLSRGFSIDGDRTDILPRDWKHLFRDPPPQTAPAPKLERMRFGVATPRSDPVH